MRHSVNQLKLYKAQNDSLACIDCLFLSKKKITYFKEYFFFLLKIKEYDDFNIILNHSSKKSDDIRV